MTDPLPEGEDVLVGLAVGVDVNNGKKAHSSYGS